MRIALENLIEGWVTINGTKVLVAGEDDYAPNSNYTINPVTMQLSTNPTTEQIQQFNKDFKQNYSDTKELYRGVASDKAILDAVNNNTVRNLRGTPVSFTINPDVAHEFANQKELGAVMVFDKDMINEHISVPDYELMDVTSEQEANLTDKLPTQWAYQEEVRGVNVSLKIGALKEIRVSSVKAVMHYKKLLGDKIPIKLVNKTQKEGVEMEDSDRKIIGKLYRGRPRSKLLDFMVNDYLGNFLNISDKDAQAMIEEYWKK